MDEHIIDHLHETAFGQKPVAPSAVPAIKKAPPKSDETEEEDDDRQKKPSVVAPMASDASQESDYNPEDILSAYVQNIKAR
ncbi:solute carrier organic anion transporter family member 2b1 [Lasius niger]|uniref:Solute carrier organic anion transporter family member 2b1 n=1 Tax=Lasius niger TaxID=67767 RepID=A0A0J7MSZ4_LASNI|nr:solute carrier organic anion transporter family member 2b1 [Lasius niger]